MQSRELEKDSTLKWIPCQKARAGKTAYVLDHNTDYSPTSGSR